YVQAGVPPLYCLLFYSLEGWPRIEPVLRLACVWLWTYVNAATYWAKLIPFYGGHTAAHTRAAALMQWYRETLPRRFDVLAATIIGPAEFVLWLALIVVIASVALAVWLSLPRHFPRTGPPKC